MGVLAVGCILGSCVGGSICDYLGRLKTIHLCCIIFVFSSSILSLSNSFSQLCMGRFFVGKRIFTQKLIYLILYVYNTYSMSSYKGIGVALSSIVDVYVLSFLHYPLPPLAHTHTQTHTHTHTHTHSHTCIYYIYIFSVIKLQLWRFKLLSQWS